MKYQTSAGEGAQKVLKELKLGKPFALTEKTYDNFVEDANGVLGPKDTKIIHYKGPSVEIYPISLFLEPPEIPELEGWEPFEELAFEEIRSETPTDKLTGKRTGDSQIYLVFDGNDRCISLNIPHDGGVNTVYASTKEKALYLGKKNIIWGVESLENHLYVRAEPGCKDVRDTSMVRTSLFPV